MHLHMPSLRGEGRRMKACLKPRIVHGLPITPKDRIYELRGESFCVSFADPRDINRAVELVDRNGILLLDNGAFTVWKRGAGRVDAEKFFAWANAVQRRCDVAVAVIPDIIMGSEDENWQEAARAVRELSEFPERLMFVWHMNDSLEGLYRAARLFNFVAIGSCAEYDVAKNRAGYLERLKQATGAFVASELLCGRRPWVHLMRGLGVLTEVPGVNSADSTNIARNHFRTDEGVAAMARRIRTAVAKAAMKAEVREALPTSNFGYA